MISKYDPNYHGHYHKKGDEKSFTTYLCTQVQSLIAGLSAGASVDLKYCERL